MSETVAFVVPGLPVPKQSTRVVVNGRGKPHGVTPPRMKAWQETVAWYAKEAMKGELPINGDLEVWITFRLPDQRRRDLDNLSKGTLDGMRGIVFGDDCQITKLCLSKVYRDAESGAVITVKQVTP